MSKSYGNTIGIFDEGKALKKKVMSIVTDSTPLEEPKDPERDNVFALVKLFADDAKREEIAAAYRAGGYGYGHAKKELLGLITEEFAEARERRKELAERPDYVRDVLHDGARKACARTDEVMTRVREAVGLVTTLTSSSLPIAHQDSTEGVLEESFGDHVEPVDNSGPVGQEKENEAAWQNDQ
jgi:tryptophanyl-tRNA synthetase